MAVTVAAAVVVVMLKAVGAVPHIAAAAVVVVVVRVGCAAVTHLALISGRQDRCKAQCRCLGPSSKPHLKGTWSLTCHKGHKHNN